MCLFVRTERIGDWELHHHCVNKMLPHFRAAGHLAYAISAHLYIQQMAELNAKTTVESSLQDVYLPFAEVKNFSLVCGQI